MENIVFTLHEQARELNLFERWLERYPNLSIKKTTDNTFCLKTNDPEKVREARDFYNAMASIGFSIEMTFA